MCIRFHVDRFALPYASSLKIPKLKEPCDHTCSHLKVSLSYGSLRRVINVLM